jgi:hypothetical protein
MDLAWPGGSSTSTSSSTGICTVRLAIEVPVLVLLNVEELLMFPALAVLEASSVALINGTVDDDANDGSSSKRSKKSCNPRRSIEYNSLRMRRIWGRKL